MESGHTPMIALLTLCLSFAGISVLLEDLPDATPNVFDLPELQADFLRLQQQATQALQLGRYEEAERSYLEACRLRPQLPEGYYNLACAQARQGKREPALASLALGVQKGFRHPELLEKDPDLESIRDDPRLADLADQVRKTAAAPAAAPPQVQPGIVRDGVAWVRETNTAWDPLTGLFHTSFAFAETTAAGSAGVPSAVASPPIVGQGQVGETLRRWIGEGTAAGNHGDFYDNHDGDHSDLSAADFPQLTWIEFDAAAKQRSLHVGLQYRFFYNQPTIGNSSMAQTDGARWRSLPRMAYTDPRLLAVLYGQYSSNHLYLYPEHRDHDLGHNGPEGYGDLYCTNTPFVVISQGSSGSDRPFLESLVCTLAALRPDVKATLIQRRALVPTLQLILRSCLRGNAPTDYRTGRAHPSVFRGEQLDTGKMIQMAHGMRRELLPPLVQLRVLEEDESLVGRDYFDVGPRERLFDSPAVVARVVRSVSRTRRIVISAEGSRDPQGLPLTWHWSVLRGDAEAIRIRPLNAAQSVVELVVPYHPRRPVEAGSKLESNRVDIGAFVHNGTYHSAPAFITFFYLDNEHRVYTEDGRIESVTYTGFGGESNYTDPVLQTPKSWRDEYEYDEARRLVGWTRHRGQAVEHFTADGALVTQRDGSGRPAEARTVMYAAVPRGELAELEQRLGDERLYYEYDSPEDRVGRIRTRERVPPTVLSSSENETP